MARILYGVHGTAHGHAIRALTVARAFLQHEFLFLTYGRGAAVLAPEFPVAELSGPLTVFRRHRVALGATVWQNAQILLGAPRFLAQAAQILKDFGPDVCLSDYEFWTPLAARQAGVPCLSLDHQHVITLCRHTIPRSQAWPHFTTGLAVRLLFSQAREYLITSFYRPPVKPGTQARLTAPLLRESVLSRRPRPGDHVVAYQSVATFPAFVPFLRSLSRPVMVYGFHQEARDGNLTFKRNSEEGFLEDLASCAYVICGGSHTLMSEALYFGKPVLSFPIQNAFEQFLNAHYLERLGYGAACLDFRPGPGLIADFESRLPQFRENLAQGDFCGNREIFRLLACFLEHRTLFPRPRPVPANGPAG
jgi:uncharacterized protein (TIGR00661 family)